MGQVFFGLLGSCALAWAVKEVPDSEAGPPAAELPRHTDIDPFAQGEARKARAQSLRCQCRFAGVRLHPNPLAIRRVGSMVRLDRWCGRNVIFLPLFRNVWWFAELIYFGAVVQLTTLQQFCRYDVYE